MSGIATGRLFLSALRLDRREPAAVREAALADLDVEVGGFLVFGGTASRVRDLTGELRERAGRPLWVAADLERGPGQQFADLPTLPPPAGLAAHPEPEEAAGLAGRLTARGAARAGVNWVLAPVLDLDVEPANPIVGPRSFGPDPELVGRLGRAWIRGCQEEGVAACAKHFPGHGRTVEDSHVELPTVSAPSEVLEQDLAPFRRVAGEVAAVMTAHVAYPALGVEGPATTSAAMVTDLLKGELGFGGMAATDALIMEGFEGGTGAAVEGWRAVRAVRAGCDLLLYPRDLAQSARTLRQAAESDPGLGERVRDALGRSEAGLARYVADGGPDAVPTGDEDAARLAEACVAPRGEPPGERLDPSEPVHVLEVDRGTGGAGEEERRGPRDEAPAAGPDLSETVASVLRRAGWTARRRGPATQTLVVAEAVPRAWAGGAELDGTARGRIRRLATADDAYLLFFGHVHQLEELAVPGACGWWPERGLVEAAARWLDRAVRE